MNKSLKSGTLEQDEGSSQGSIPPEVLQRVKLIEITTRKKVNALFSGEYHTVFKGQGMTFSDFREYVPGDDVRSISWVVTARTNKTYVKQYEEERELSVILAVDISASCHFGSQEHIKSDVMSFVAAVLAMSAIKNKDQVGLLLFSDQVEHYIPPAKGRNQFMRLIRDIEYVKPKSKGSHLVPALMHLNQVLKKRALVFVISDFLGLPDYSENLKYLSRKHEVIAMVVQDPWEKQWPDLGVCEFRDWETGETHLLDTSSYDFIKSYEDNQNQLSLERQQLLSRSQVDQCFIPAQENWDEALVKFFRRRRGLKTL
jgi:uncharacterized protein (DUF58 family)